MKEILKSIKHWCKWNIATPICHLLNLQAPTDWISAYSFMSKKMLPYFLQFKKKKKYGYPLYVSEYFKDEVASLGFVYNKEAGTYSGEVSHKRFEEWAIEKWAWVIDEIIFALQDIVLCETDDDCQVPNPNYNPAQKECFYTKPCKDSECVEMLFNKDYGKTILDYKLYELKQERVATGLKLMGEFWRCIWD